MYSVHMRNAKKFPTQGTTSTLSPCLWRTFAEDDSASVKDGENGDELHLIANDGQ